MKHWEQRAIEREQADPRRRATVMVRLIAALAAQLPTLLAASSGLLGAVAVWHLVVTVPTGDPSVPWRFGVPLFAALLMGAAALWTWNRNVPPERANVVAFGAALLATAVTFAHLALTGDVVHVAGFVLILMTSAAVFQDGVRVAVASAIVLIAWVLGFMLAGTPAVTWPPVIFVMVASVMMTAIISSNRIQALRRLEAVNLELETQMRLDALTRIPNRRAFEERLEALWTRFAGEGGTPLAIILLDLDHFKNLNDTRGHVEGDAALRQVGGVLQMAVRSSEDLPARLGGEEFGVLLPRTKPEHALLVAERIRDAVSFTRIPNPGAPTGDTLTASLGVAVIRPGREGKPTELLERADAALYAAKRDGRNRVVLDEGPKEITLPEDFRTNLDPTELDRGPGRNLPPATDDPFKQA